MAAREKGAKKEAILRALAQMLESNPGGKITTAALAAEIGVSEAALYRHFPSKARMFEGLIDFMEDTIFSRISFFFFVIQSSINGDWIYSMSIFKTSH